MNKIITIVLLALLAVGCASTSAPEPVEAEHKTYSKDDLYMARRETVKKCILELMEREAHVIDATDSCLHIYGLNSNKQRVKTLGN